VGIPYYYIHDERILIASNSVGGWVDWGLLDTADTKSLNSGDLDVTGLSPDGSPGVSNEVVLLARLDSVTNGGDGVVEGGSASLGVQDTGFVLLEDGSVGLNGDGDWSLGNGGLQLGNGSSWDGGIGLDINFTGVLGSSAGLVSSLVGVVVLEVLSLLLGVFEGVRLPSTVASIGGGVAINELLLGEGEEVSGGDEVSTFNGSGGGESPAWSALSLVLDGVDGTLGDPVDLGVEVLGVENSGFLLGEVSWLFETKESLVLEIGEGGELVVTEDERVLGGIDLLDLGVLLDEEVHSELVLLLGSVVETEGVDVLHEILLDLIRDCDLTDEKAEVSTGRAKHVHFWKLIGSNLKLIKLEISLA
jgi:hypothetical protein